jgi:DNA-directed RNA polymerase specialized sigma24 family protein
MTLTFYLIHQRVVEGLSWQEIQAQYGADYGGAEIPEATLRQRYSRGRKKLRKIFHTVMASR